jgi:hypothetical protein
MRVFRPFEPTSRRLIVPSRSPLTLRAFLCLPGSSQSLRFRRPQALGIAFEVLARSGSCARRVTPARACDGTQERRILLACILRVTKLKVLKEPLRLPIVARAKGRHGARKIVIVRACSRCLLAQRRLEGSLRLGQRRLPRPGR